MFWQRIPVFSPGPAMYFDYTIVLAFALAGAVFVLVNRKRWAHRQAGLETDEPVELPGVRFDARNFAAALAATVFAAATLLLFPAALVLRDCLHDTDAAQSTGIGVTALIVGGVFLAALSAGVAYVRRQRGPDAIGGVSAADSGP